MRRNGQIWNQPDSDTNSRVIPIIIKFLRKDRFMPDTTREERIVSSTNYSDNFKSHSDNGSLFRLLDVMPKNYMEMNKKEMPIL